MTQLVAEQNSNPASESVECNCKRVVSSSPCPATHYIENGISYR